MDACAFTVVLPFYNEADYLPACLESWLRQERMPDQLILVDNGSDDGSEAVCRRLLAAAPISDILYLREPRPGKIHALETACRHIRGRYTAFADADITYPPHYLDLAFRLLDGACPESPFHQAWHVVWGPEAPRGGRRVVAAMALYAHGERDSAPVRAYLGLMPWLSRIFPTKCLTGGGGQIVETAALREAGGFSRKWWDLVLLDHEVMHRVLKRGRTLYHPDLWCQHSPRRGDRRRVRWTLWERFLYLYMPPRRLDWFFYRYLGPRLRRRGQDETRLREKPWRPAPTSA